MLGVVTILSLAGRRGEACSCFQVGGGTRIPFDQFETVFLGTVSTVETIEVGEGAGRLKKRLVVFTTDSVWKGPHLSAQSVYTGLGGGDCGFVFEVGRQYLVTATEDGGPRVGQAFGKGDDTPFTDICMWTAPVAEAGETIRQLERDFKRWKPRWRRSDQEWP